MRLSLHGLFQFFLVLLWSKSDHKQCFLDSDSYADPKSPLKWAALQFVFGEMSGEPQECPRLAARTTEHPCPGRCPTWNLTGLSKSDLECCEQNNCGSTVDHFPTELCYLECRGDQWHGLWSQQQRLRSSKWEVWQQVTGEMTCGMLPVCLKQEDPSLLNILPMGSCSGQGKNTESIQAHSKTGQRPGHR